MPLKPKNYLKIKKPTAQMIEQAKKMAIARKEMLESKKLGNRHILEVEAETAMYKHAMNLAEEMWKHYNSIIILSKKPKKEHLQSRQQAEIDFQNYSAKYEYMKKHIEKRMAPRKVYMNSQ